jgi:predicted transglutaminase-like cysteine proteinase
MDRARLRLSALALAATSVCGVAPAQASIGFGILPVSIAFSAMTPQRTLCASGLAAGSLDTSNSPQANGSVSKTTALLGGKVSQLELIAQQQAAGSALQGARTALASAMAAEPRADRSSGNCRQFALPADLQGQTRPGLRTTPRGPDDFLASARVSIKHTNFDASWNRVRRESLPRGLTRELAGLGAGRSGSDMLGAVNAWTNARVRDVDDRLQYGQADYWASASTTLTRRAGDCEDVAIAKLQILAAMGVERSDMYLTITRDLIRNADHAVLVVKADGKFWLLDNATDQLLDAAASNNYRPIMSFSTARSWLHGNWHPAAR